MTDLFKPIQIGRYQLNHRIVMPPMTRMRAEQPHDVPSDMMASFYAQRASEGGLLIAESTPVARNGIAYYGGPGAYRDEQIAGWKKVTSSVHAKGARIFLQLSHSGRMSHPSVIEGETPAGPSVVTADTMAINTEGLIDCAEPRALDISEIPGIILQYRQAAERALAAGFDGVELHSANGYLPDQFLQDGTNHRTDEYGGSIENRARFLLEVVDQFIDVWGADRVGVRVSPSGKFSGMKDSNPEATFSYAASELSKRGIAYLHVIEPRIIGADTLVADADPVASATLRKVFAGPIIAAGGFDQASAEKILKKGDADMVAFGRIFTANPDLPERMRNGYPLAQHRREYFFGGTEVGYLDFPTYQEA